MNPGTSLRGLDVVSPFESIALSPSDALSPYVTLAYRARILLWRKRSNGVKGGVSRSRALPIVREPVVYYIEARAAGANRV